MLSKIIQINQLCTELVSFYTIKFEDKEISEFKDFERRLSIDPRNESELDEIFTVIQEIGDRGANLRRYFNREENNAYALPPIGNEYFIETQDFGIRLYCVVLNEGIVFLLNGDRKKTLKATAPGSNVSRFFYMANSLHKELMKDSLQKFIQWHEKELLFDDDYLINVQG